MAREVRFATAAPPNALLLSVFHRGQSAISIIVPTPPSITDHGRDTDPRVLPLGRHAR
jgi:hypothetical protein